MTFQSENNKSLWTAYEHLGSKSFFPPVCIFFFTLIPIRLEFYIMCQKLLLHKLWMHIFTTLPLNLTLTWPTHVHTRSTLTGITVFVGTLFRFQHCTVYLPEPPNTHTAVHCLVFSILKNLFPISTLNCIGTKLWTKKKTCFYQQCNWSMKTTKTVFCPKQHVSENAAHTAH